MTRPDRSPSGPLDTLAGDLLAVIRRHDPAWTDFNASDPGVTLLGISTWVAERIGTQRSDPYRDFKFRVKWDGTVVAGVERVSALRRVTEIVDYREGGAPDVVRRMPGRVTWEPFAVERALGGDTRFEDWAAAVSQGGTTGWRKDVRLEILDHAGRLFLAYDVHGCWPAAYRILPTLTESLTLVPEGWQRDRSVQPVG
jgi:phage tail-like protein